MKIISIIIFLLLFKTASGQTAFVPIDTTSASCKNILEPEYKKKFDVMNKGLSALASAQRGITKEIYTELQGDFLDKIAANTFICDDKIAPYLKELMDEVLSKNGIKRDNYKILLSRDAEINAYNTGDGTVVVNYGMFLCAANEDELVFVICHEIGHQYLNHVYGDIEAFARRTTSDEITAKIKEIKKQKYGKASMATGLIKSIRYQNYSERRKKEIQADSLGLVFYRKTARNPNAAVTLLEKLDHADTEKDSLTIADYRIIFETTGFKLKEKYFVQEQSLFKQYDKDKRFEADSLKTHPDCTTRIKLIEGSLAKQTGTDYGDSTVFNQIKMNSALQNLYNLYTIQKYGPSLYEALKLYKTNTSDVTLKHIIYLNLEKIYASKVNYTITRYVPTHDNVHNTASLNRFVSFVNNIKLSDLEIIINNFKN